jgi:UDP-N-acetylmuramoyl-tripeptide--D-alanyl-D-alanine ligase
MDDGSAMLTLADIWHALIGADASALGPLAEQPIRHVVIDSRAAERGDLFVALRGERTDGHLYIAGACNRGAVAVIAEARGMADGGLALADYCVADCTTGTLENPKPQIETPRTVFIVRDSLTALQQLAAHWRAQMNAVTVGITGSVGKTTTKETVANVLAQQYVTLRSEGNLNNEIGLPLTLLRLSPEHQRLVVEMGMYALGEIARLCELARPRIGVVTNVGPTHLERLGSIERIAQAKSELPQALPSAAEGGVAILNADEPLVLAMAGMTRARVFTYGLNPDSHLWADEIESHGLDGIGFRLHYGSEAFHIRLPMLGRHSVHTALRGAAVGLVDGLGWTEILSGLQEVRGQLRLMVVPGLRDTMLIDDTYNASPDSMLAALNLLAEIANTSHRSIAVLGDMYELGSYEEAGHRLAGGRAAQVVTKLITVGQRSRWTADEALACGMRRADVYPVESSVDAVAVLQGLMRPGDVVLIKGSRAAAMEGIVDALSRPRSARSEQA